MISGIIMAAGYSKRMGQNKLLMEFKGRKIIEYVIEAIIQSKIDEILLIYRDTNLKALGRKHGIKTIFNENAHEGQSQSIVCGVKNSMGNSYMFFPGDQPFIKTELIDLLIDAHKLDSKKILVPFYKDKRYTPTIFPKIFKEELLNLKGDKGGREIIENNPDKIRKIEILDKNILVDIDTIEDFNYWSSTQI